MACPRRSEAALMASSRCSFVVIGVLYITRNSAARLGLQRRSRPRPKHLADLHDDDRKAVDVPADAATEVVGDVGHSSLVHEHLHITSAIARRYGAPALGLFEGEELPERVGGEVVR